MSLEDDLKRIDGDDEPARIDSWTLELFADRRALAEMVRILVAREHVNAQEWIIEGVPEDDPVRAETRRETDGAIDRLWVEAKKKAGAKP